MLDTRDSLDSPQSGSNIVILSHVFFRVLKRYASVTLCVNIISSKYLHLEAPTFKLKNLQVDLSGSAFHFTIFTDAGFHVQLVR